MRSELVSIRMTPQRAAQVAALEQMTGLSGVASIVDFALATTLAQYNRGGREMKTEDQGMDKRTFLVWFFGGEVIDPLTELAAREAINAMSADNGHDASPVELARYIGWLREEGVIED